MYFLMFFVLVCIPTCHCLVAKDEDTENPCNILTQLLDHSSVSVEIRNKGFHREVVTTVELSPELLKGVTVLLVHRWPRGVYLDPYQLKSLSDHSNWKILLDSSIDLEVPAHKTLGFVSYLYPTIGGSTPWLITVTLPVHGRYHQASSDGKISITINIEAPLLLLRAEQGCQLSSESHAVIDAPCTPNNTSTCSWVQRQHQQENNSVSFQLPVGDGSMMTPVCAGSLLVTVTCCVLLSKYMWKHRNIQTL